ncbi:acylaminoacyl-peptidase [Enterococcus larvae]|uniref:acylaminoacyl-peptidase n=1 Tax=Enterococcus larvae TaxID=2794352 RepID=UPI003F324139
MNSNDIKSILQKHGVEQSDKLSIALDEILKAYSKDPANAKAIKKGIGDRDYITNSVKGIR